jgi:hypothetical protein
MNTMLRRTLLVLALSTGLHALDLRTATIVAGPQDRKVATMLQQEIEKRTRLTLPIAERAAGPAITLSGRPTIPAVAGPEGYRVQVVNNTVHLAGNDRRGTLFAAGALLRHLHMDRDTLEIPDDFKLATAPKYPSAATSSATGPRPTPTTAGTSPCGSSTSATWPSSAPTPSS